jgi:hypothetical protein
MFVFFAWVIWIWMLFSILGDVFRRGDIGGGKKAVWTVFLILTPFLGVLAYLVTNSQSMAERRTSDMAAQRAHMDEYVRSVAGGGGAAAEIEKAQALLASGAITQDEFQAIKAMALA